MTPITLDLTSTANTGPAAPSADRTPESGFEVELSGGVRWFDSADDIQDAILRGEIPRASRIRQLDAGKEAADDEKWTTVEDWAKSDSKLRRLYVPIWHLSLKGAFVGVCVVGALKALDTLVALASVNDAAALLWLLIGAAIFSPKWKMQLMGASLFAGIKSGVSMTALWGAWMGVGIFAAVFGVTAGMAIGTIVGLVRSNSHAQAPDAAGEGSKPVVWGLMVPLALFVLAVIGYVQVFVPAFLKMIEQ